MIKNKKSGILYILVYNSVKKVRSESFDKNNSITNKRI